MTVNKNPQEANNTKDNYSYDLSAVVTHKGYKSTESGHYVADIFRYIFVFVFCTEIVLVEHLFKM